MELSLYGQYNPKMVCSPAEGYYSVVLFKQRCKLRGFLWPIQVEDWETLDHTSLQIISSLLPFICVIISLTSASSSRLQEVTNL